MGGDSGVGADREGSIVARMERKRNAGIHGEIGSGFRCRSIRATLAIGLLASATEVQRANTR